MKGTLTIILFFVNTLAFGQNEILKKYQDATDLRQKEKYPEAYEIYKEIEPICDKNDTLYEYILWYYTVMTTEIESSYRMNEQFDSSLKYGLESLTLIEKGKPFFPKSFTAREYWIHKNVIVSYFGLGRLDDAQKHKDILYQAYKDKKLPDGLDGYFNFTFFKWEDKNIWGYEWYPELGDPETKGSFSKIVYYVYSTNPDGSDKDQLYRLHVLKFHKFDDSVKFDYVLTKRLETAKGEVGGTLYAYTYNKDIDYVKLQSDIKEVLKGNLEPDTKSIIKKK